MRLCLPRTLITYSLIHMKEKIACRIAATTRLLEPIDVSASPFLFLLFYLRGSGGERSVIRGRDTGMVQ